MSTCGQNDREKQKYTNKHYHIYQSIYKFWHTSSGIRGDVVIITNNEVSDTLIFNWVDYSHTPLSNWEDLASTWRPTNVTQPLFIIWGRVLHTPSYNKGDLISIACIKVSNTQIFNWEDNFSTHYLVIEGTWCSHNKDQCV